MDMQLCVQNTSQFLTALVNEQEANKVSRTFECETRRRLEDVEKDYKKSQLDHLSITSGTNRNNPKQCKRLFQLLENVDDAGPFDDGGVAFSQAVLKAVEDGQLCEENIYHVPCRCEERKIAARAKRKKPKNSTSTPRRRKISNLS